MRRTGELWRRLQTRTLPVRAFAIEDEPHSDTAEQ
jgi:hypothetical protein